MRIFEKFTDMAVAVLVIFIVPGLWAVGKIELAEDICAEAAVSRLCDEIEISGGIGAETLKQFENRIQAVYGAEAVVITFIERIYEPVYEKSVFTGRCVCSERLINHEEIEGYIFENGGFFPRGEGRFEIVAEGNRCRIEKSVYIG